MVETEGRKLKILIVEDVISLREILEDEIGNAGHIVLAAGTGQEGLEAGEQDHPDVIVADIFMPEMGGIEMGQKIRATAWGKDIPIIYITNMMVNADVRAAISSLNRSVCLDKSKVSIPDIIEIAVKSATTGLASNS